MSLGIRQTWASESLSCVTLGQLHNVFEPPYPHPKTGDKNSTLNTHACLLPPTQSLKQQRQLVPLAFCLQPVPLPGHTAFTSLPGGMPVHYQLLTGLGFAVMCYTLTGD